MFFKRFLDIREPGSKFTHRWRCLDAEPAINDKNFLTHDLTGTCQLPSKNRNSKLVQRMESPSLLLWLAGNCKNFSHPLAKKPLLMCHSRLPWKPSEKTSKWQPPAFKLIRSDWSDPLKSLCVDHGRVVLLSGHLRHLHKNVAISPSHGLLVYENSRTRGEAKCLFRSYKGGWKAGAAHII